MRKNFISSFIIALGIFPFLFSACDSKKAPTLPGSGGKTCEIMVVCPKVYFESALGDSLRAFFMQAQVGLNQEEPLFTLANIQPEAFNKSEMFQHHRNILIVEFDKSKKAKMEMQENYWATPQTIFKFTVPDPQAFYPLFQAKRNQILWTFYDKEYLRIQKVFKKSEAINVSSRLSKQYGFKLTFPDGFDFAASKSDFAWIRKESKEYGQGILISIFPYKDLSIFDLQQIIRKRNEISAKVPGPGEGSYMTTEDRFPEANPISKPINFNGLYAMETRGIWRLEKDFMGGPFVNYVFVDTALQRVIMLDAYLYSPRKAKRDLLMQMEAIARSLVFTPKDTTSINSKENAISKNKK